MLPYRKDWVDKNYGIAAWAVAGNDMKYSRFRCLVAMSLFYAAIASGQGFSNLDFEQSTIVLSVSSGNGYDEGLANVPYWTEYNGWSGSNYPGGTTLIYNDRPIDNPGVCLEGAHSPFVPFVLGNYSVLLYGGSSSSEGGTNGAAIGQTGQIPANAQSISFLGYGGESMRITFNGHLLSFSDSYSETGFILYTADISAYAGQTGELLFTEPWQAGTGLIDDIQFLTTPVPEPSTFAFLGFSAGMLYLFRRHIRSQPG